MQHINHNIYIYVAHIIINVSQYLRIVLLLRMSSVEKIILVFAQKLGASMEWTRELCIILLINNNIEYARY